MKYPYGLWIAVPLGVGVLFGLYRAAHSWGPETSAATRPAGGDASAEVAEVRQELAQLRAQVRNQGRQQAVDHGHAANPESGAARAARMAPEARAEAERQRQAHVAAVREGFQNEAIDPQWSSATASAVHEVVAGDEQLRPVVRGVECRSRSCRVEITGDGSARLVRIALQLAQRVGHELPSVVYDHVEDAGGAATMILYMSRPD